MGTLLVKFCVTSYGESHGTAIGCVIDGCPLDYQLVKNIYKRVDLRKPGTSKYVTQRKAKDLVKILSETTDIQLERL